MKRGGSNKMARQKKKAKHRKNAKYNEVLERRVRTVFHAFLLLSQNDYGDITEYTLKPHREKRLERFVEEKTAAFYRKGEASAVFYCFELVVAREKRRTKNNKIISLYDFQFFIRFIRYDD
ncbi:MAG: hypothetical protein DRH12_16075, partial [Deltaproteobacteria bacterium]